MKTEFLQLPTPSGSARAICWLHLQALFSFSSCWLQKGNQPKKEKQTSNFGWQHTKYKMQIIAIDLHPASCQLLHKTQALLMSYSMVSLNTSVVHIPELWWITGKSRLGSHSPFLNSFSGLVSGCLLSGWEQLCEDKCTLGLLVYCHSAIILRKAWLILLALFCVLSSVFVYEVCKSSRPGRNMVCWAWKAVLSTKS